ncbi:hypothetical protein DSO57_1015606 [Entomophthora muscae]|uniref:Uncharacterized protein n=1 Tax=Entomophthora muscae TaxID=34485 RepID=A0ACC2SI66_9FUNG|nr:hypothetical protein DSO57_1015606 [Entomophthora muscae]
MDIPCPCVLIGWYSFIESKSPKLQALSYLSLFPNFQDSTACQIIQIDSCSEADAEEFLWELQSINSIKLEFAQLEVQGCTSALIDDGPLVFLIHRSLGKADWDMFTWDVSSNEHSYSKLNSAQKALGILSMPDKLFLIHTQSTSLTCTHLIATHLALNLVSNDAFDCGIPSDIATNLSSAYITDLSFEGSTEISNPNQDCLLKGWLGLTGGQVISLGSVLSESYNLKEALSFDQGHYDVQFIQPNPQGKGILIKLLAKKHLESPLQWIFICSGEYKKIYDVAIASSYGAMLHILLNTEKRLKITDIHSLTEGTSSHPALDGALHRLVSHCQTEAACCADSCMLLLQKARLIQDELVLLQSVGFEASSSLSLGPVKQIYPTLAPPPTTYSYFHALESTHANEVELDPDIGPWLPPSHRVIANCAGFFYNPFVLGQTWMQLHITNIHCNSVYQLDVLACLTLPDAQLEVQIYWPSDYSNQLTPSMYSTPTLLLHIIKLPTNCMLQSVWKHLCVSVKWKEQTSARIYQSHVPTPHYPILLTRCDFLPISPVVLLLAWSPSIFKLSSLLQLNFGMKFLATETAFLCQVRCLVVKVLQPSSEAMQLCIHGLSPTLLWDFISRLSNLLASLDIAPPSPCLEWQPSTMLIPAHCSTLKRIKDRHAVSEYSALLVYLMGKLHLA